MTSNAESPAGEPERELRRRFAVRLERFHEAGLELELLLPTSADSLIDEAEFKRDERLPYWAELWPSARALARHLAEAAIPHGAAIVELGCGVGLPSLVLAARGHPVLATDYEADALAFTRANAERNGIEGIDVCTLDWREPGDIEPVDLIVAADVLYERRNAVALAALLPLLLTPTGTLLLADPGRMHQHDFRAAVTGEGWLMRIIDERKEISDPATGAVSRVAIFAVQRT